MLIKRNRKVTETVEVTLTGGELQDLIHKALTNKFGIGRRAGQGEFIMEEVAGKLTLVGFRFRFLKTTDDSKKV